MYALLRSDFSNQDNYYTKDNIANIDREFVKRSSHSFFIQMTSVYHIHLNTLDSGVKVRYSITNEEHEFVSGTKNFLTNHVGFG